MSFAAPGQLNSRLAMPFDAANVGFHGHKRVLSQPTTQGCTIRHIPLTPDRRFVAATNFFILQPSSADGSSSGIEATRILAADNFT
jgi:hypothetical protein